MTLLLALLTAATVPGNLIENPGLEPAADGQPAGWGVIDFKTGGTGAYSPEAGHDGPGYVIARSADATQRVCWFQKVAIPPGTAGVVFGGWYRNRNLPPDSRRGPSLRIHFHRSLDQWDELSLQQVFYQPAADWTESAAASSCPRAPSRWCSRPSSGSPPARPIGTTCGSNPRPPTRSRSCPSTPTRPSTATRSMARICPTRPPTAAAPRSTRRRFSGCPPDPTGPTGSKSGATRACKATARSAGRGWPGVPRCFASHSTRESGTGVTGSRWAMGRSSGARSASSRCRPTPRLGPILQRRRSRSRSNGRACS